MIFPREGFTLVIYNYKTLTHRVSFHVKIHFQNIACTKNTTTIVVRILYWKYKTTSNLRVIVFSLVSLC